MFLFDNMKKSYTCIIGLLVFIAGVFFIRCYYHELSGDELIYTYIWEPDDPTRLWADGHRFEHKADNIADILQTQVRHYKEVNGRFFLHVIEMLFTGHMLLFSVINTGIFLAFIWLMVWYVSQRKWDANYLLWLIVASALLYLFPYRESLWTSVNYGLNYLWPATLSMLGLLIWERLDKGSSFSKFALIAFAFLGFFLGWSNEAFSIGFSGGVFIYYCFNFKKFRGDVLWFVVPLWIGTIGLTIAPGNFIRFAGATPREQIPLIWKIIHGVENIFELKIVWIFVVFLFLNVFRPLRSSFKKWLRQESKLVAMLAVTVPFCILCNSRPHSATMIEFITCLLLLKYICMEGHRISKKFRIGFGVVLSVFFFGTQTLLAVDAIKLYDVQSRLMQDYRVSEDGLVSVPPSPISTFSVPYFRGGDPSFWWDVSNYIQGVYGKWQKNADFYLEQDFEALDTASNFYTAENRCPGDAPIYHKRGGMFYWLNPEEHNQGATYSIVYEPRDYRIEGPFYVKIKYGIFPDKENYCENLGIDTVETRFGKSYRLSAKYSDLVLGFRKNAQ